MAILTLFERHLLEDLARWYVEEVKRAIREKPIKRRSIHQPDGFSAPANATGRLADSVQFAITNEAIEIRCLDYIDKLIFGQPPGEKVDPTEIELWLEAKGLDYNPNSVARNIRLVGNSIWNEFHGDNSGLLLDINVQEKVSEIREKIAKHGIKEMADTIFKDLKLAA